MNSRVQQVEDALDGKQPIRFCKDCKYIQRTFFRNIAPDAKCLHQNANRNVKYLVTSKMTDNCTCIQMRDGPCGREGKLYEARGK